MIGGLRHHWLPDDHRAEAAAGRAYAAAQRAHCARAHGGVLGITVECEDCTMNFVEYEVLVTAIDRAARRRP